MQYFNFGKFIRQKRLQSGISLNNFAIQNDIEPAVLCRIETEKQDIKLNTLIKIATGFNLKASELLKEFEDNSI